MVRRIAAFTSALGFALALGWPAAPVIRGAQDEAIFLRGTIILPAGVLRHGYVGVAGGRIIAVSADLPDTARGVVVNTNGIIVPGFVDVHNHVPWNVLPRWTPSRFFTNQTDWADSIEFDAIRHPFDRLLPSLFCEMNAWGELRALVGGTTSILATQPAHCIHGLVRNLDFNSGFYGTTQLNREHVYNVGFRFPPPSDAAGRTEFVLGALALIQSPFYEALVLHAAEGVDAYAAEQFAFLQTQGLLNPKGVLIHGIPLGSADFAAMAANGTALVWSPRSNLELYGATAEVEAALDAGVEVALAPDWALTGSSSLLDELKAAWQWNRAYLGGRLTDRQLVEMATSVAARVVGIDDEVGAIQEGLRADLVVLRGETENPFRSVVQARAEDVQLVVINGVPLYGDRPLMERLWRRDDLETISVGDQRKAFALPATRMSVGALAHALTLALEAEGTTLAPLAEQGGPFRIP